ncbi:FkbM family methyltransferase [Falsiroseomonas sp. E2-1-a4]|uniref:FkbM family methyltransferase n=1 Tax=Falsiroseomonas sp. E2-1-a4 TaxID=3239299 RepID=UPI003F2D4C06
MFRRLFPSRPGPTRPAPASRNTYCFLGNRAVALTHSGLKIFLDVRDVGMTPHIALSGEWERHVERLLRRLLKPGAQVVEVGASMGYHTLAMAQAVGATGHVHAFEANPRVLALLRDSVAVNGFDGRVTVHAAAALAEPGRIAFAVHPAHIGSGHVALAETVAGYPERFEARGVRIDDALAELPAADLMRLDCEGSEPQALRGAEALIRRSPDLLMVTEWDIHMMGAREDVGAFEAWLRDLGLVYVQEITPGGLKPLAEGSLAGLTHADLLLSRRPLGQI